MPIDKVRVSSVLVCKSDANGDPFPAGSITTSAPGTLDCPGSATQPYTLVGSRGYTQTDRHDAIAEGLDIVGVRIGYLYSGITPVGSGRTWIVSDGATLRMEPKQ